MFKMLYRYSSVLVSNETVFLILNLLLHHIPQSSGSCVVIISKRIKSKFVALPSQQYNERASANGHGS